MRGSTLRQSQGDRHARSDSDTAFDADELLAVCQRRLSAPTFPRFPIDFKPL
jgi:hypothetical protein